MTKLEGEIVALIVCYKCKKYMIHLCMFAIQVLYNIVKVHSENSSNVRNTPSFKPYLPAVSTFIA